MALEVERERDMERKALGTGMREDARRGGHQESCNSVSDVSAILVHLRVAQCLHAIIHDA